MCDYVHLNPSRAKILKPEDVLESYPWSSYPSYSKGDDSVVRLRKDRLLGEHGIRKDDQQERREYARRMEARRLEPEDAFHVAIRRGWKLGAEDFLDRLRDYLRPVSSESHPADQVKEAMGVKARRLIEKELESAGIAPRDLAALSKGHPIKLRLARRLRQETTLTLKEVAEALHAGSWRTLANHLVKMKD